MNKMILAKIICMQEIWVNQNMNIWFKNVKMQGIKHLNNPDAFIECWNTMDGVYENINDYNPIRKTKKLVVFDDMIVDIIGNNQFQAIMKKFFIRCRKLNISLVFIIRSYFSVPKDVKLNTTHYFIMKINSNYKITKYCN